MASIGDIRILVVDDNPRMRTLARAILRAAGVNHGVDAAGAEPALDYLKTASVDVVLADWNMEPIDGIEFTRQVRFSDEVRNPCVPILMMTAHTEASRVAAARDAGVTGFLRKPISARLLFDRLSAVLLDRRLFFRTPSFFGPDRRRALQGDYVGPLRRASDRGNDTLDLDESRWTA